MIFFVSKLLTRNDFGTIKYICICLASLPLVESLSVAVYIQCVQSTFVRSNLVKMVRVQHRGLWTLRYIQLFGCRVAPVEIS